MLTGGGGPAVGPVQRSPVDRSPGPFVSRVRGALVVGSVSGVGVWVLFAVLPFLRAGSGAVGAFLAAAVATLLFRRRPRA